MVSTRGYSLLLLGLLDIPVRNVYHDSNGKGKLYKPFVIYAGPTSGVYLRVPKPLTSTPLDTLLSLPLAYCFCSEAFYFYFYSFGCLTTLVVGSPATLSVYYHVHFYLVNLDGCDLFRLTSCKGG